MSAKAKPAHRMRRHAVVATFSMKGGDKAPLYRVTSSRNHEQGNHRRQTGRFDCGGLFPIKQALNCMVNADLAQSQAT